MTGRAPRSGRPVGIGGDKAEKSVSLALQGGGAHGAFTWGVLDALLADGRIAIEAITGASAGAMNAIVMTDGYIRGGTPVARQQLRNFWRGISINGALTDGQRSFFDQVAGFWSAFLPSPMWANYVQSVASPYDLNPLNINKLKSVVGDLIDFEAIRACEDIKLFVSATNVHTGKIRVFGNQELSADHLMASACLPTLFQAVEIDGVPYWDGGYSGNPALYPLFYGVEADDVLLVQINPIERKTTPMTAREIQERLTEISFNSGLIRELRAINFVTRLIDDGKLSPDEYKRVRMHRIDADKALAESTASSRLHADWGMFKELRDAGRAATRAWLKANYDAIGERSTLDLRETID